MMKLSRPVHAAMLMLLLVACCHHFQLSESDCAKPSLSSSTPREKKAAVFPSAQRHDAEDDGAHLPSIVGDVVVGRTKEDASGRAAPSSDATTPVQGKEEEGVGSGPWEQQRTGTLRRAALLRSRLQESLQTARPPTSADDDAAAPGSSASATSARAVVVGAVVASSRPRQTSDRRALLVRAGTMTPPAVLLLRSKLARRFLLADAGVDEAAASATDGASPSCGSNNPHIHCGPSTSKP